MTTYAQYNLIQYVEGDGNDAIEGFSSATLSAVNIAGNESNPLLITLTEGNDSLLNSLDGMKINALGGSDTILNGAYRGGKWYRAGNNVSINGGAGKLASSC